MTYELTKMDIAALRSCNMLSVHLVNGKGTVRAIKENRPTEKAPFAQDIEHIMPIDVTLRSGFMHNITAYTATARCHSLMYVYQNQVTHVTSVIRTLRAGDAISFIFYADGGSTGYMAPLGIHGDKLYLNVYRKGVQVARFEVNDCICPNNSARMVQGVPDSESYKADAVRFATV